MPIYKLKDRAGYRVEVNQTDSFGKKKTIVRQNKSTLTYKDAKLVEAKLVAEIKTTKGSKDITFNDLLKYYIDTKQYEIRKITLEKNVRVLNHYMLNDFGNRKVNSVTKQDFQAWKNKINKNNFKTTYKNSLYSLFVNFINFGIKYDYIDDNKLQKLGNFKSVNDMENSNINFWTVEEFKKFIAVVRSKCEELTKNGDEDDLVNWGYYVIYNMMYWCGLRKSEAYALKWSDYYNNELHITKGLIHKLKGQSYTIGKPKTKKSIRNAPVPDNLKKILKEHYDRCKCGELFNKDLFICGGIEPLTDTKLCEFKNICCKEAHVKQIRIHDLRHSFATLLVKNGANAPVVAEFMGHSDIKMTWNVYSHVDNDSKNQILEMLNSLDQ